MHRSQRTAATASGPPPGPRYRRHLAEQPRPAAPDPFSAGADAAADRRGPVFPAGFDGECAEPFCQFGGDIYEGEAIRADGDGGYVHEECAEDD